MITVLVGENSFEIDRAKRALVQRFDGGAETFDGSDIELKQLPDLLMGGTLFATERLVIIKNMSDNKTIWPVFGDWLPRISDDIHLILIEPKLDKRTKTYKDLQKVATITEYKPWSERDTAQAEQWVAGEAKVLGCEIDRDAIRLLVRRVGVDQWLLHQALYKLAVYDTVTQELIMDAIDANPVESVFEVFEAALKGDTMRLKQILTTLAVTEDPYRLFGLLSGQAFQLAAVAVADGRSDTEVAKDIGVHPYGLGKLSGYARRLGRAGVRQAIDAFSEADSVMKSSATDPWLLIERALIKVSQRSV